MVKLCDETLREALDCFKTRGSYQDVADSIGASRRLIFNWIEKSKAGHPLFKLTYDNRDEWWHEHVARVRGECMWITDPDLADCDLDTCEALTGHRDRWKRDANGECIAFMPEDDETPPPLGDIEDLRARARAEPQRVKTRPDSPVSIMRATDSPGDPVERVTGATQKPTVAEHERANPRAYISPNADLKPPPRKSWARPLDTYDPTGQREPPETGRMTMATQRINYADRIHHGVLRVHDGK